MGEGDSRRFLIALCYLIYFNGVAPMQASMVNQLCAPYLELYLNLVLLN